MTHLSLDVRQDALLFLDILVGQPAGGRRQGLGQ